MIKLLVMTYSKTDREYFKAMLSGGVGGSGWLREVDVHTADGPLERTEDYLAYDGIILDYLVDGAPDGVEIARTIHHMDWKVPIMLVTNVPPESLPLDTLDFVDQVAFKQSGGISRTFDDIFGAVRCLMRQIGRIRQASLTPA